MRADSTSIFKTPRSRAARRPRGCGGKPTSSRRPRSTGCVCPKVKMQMGRPTGFQTQHRVSVTYGSGPETRRGIRGYVATAASRFHPHATAPGTCPRLPLDNAKRGGYFGRHERRERPPPFSHAVSQRVETRPSPSRPGRHYLSYAPRRPANIKFGRSNSRSEGSDHAGQSRVPKGGNPPQNPRRPEPRSYFWRVKRHFLPDCVRFAEKVQRPGIATRATYGRWRRPPTFFLFNVTTGSLATLAPGLV